MLPQICMYPQSTKPIKIPKIISITQWIRIENQFNKKINNLELIFSTLYDSIDPIATAAISIVDR